MGKTFCKNAHMARFIQAVKVEKTLEEQVWWSVFSRRYLSQGLCVTVGLFYFIDCVCSFIFDTLKLNGKRI